jgi:hypothetical protein
MCLERMSLMPRLIHRTSETGVGCRWITVGEAMMMMSLPWYLTFVCSCLREVFNCEYRISQRKL